MSNLTGTLIKMPARLDAPVAYELALGEHRIDLNARLGQPLKLTFGGNIYCDACGRKTKKATLRATAFPA
ncbi:DUF2797 domain-containing protein [Oceanimonas sp. NS1]|nr:DUF2797 domain-containing protein [Oceanimonas sp. NS1]